jgi:amidophosphoribosyltransferase
MIMHNCGVFGIWNDDEAKLRAYQLGMSLHDRGKDTCGMGCILGDGDFSLHRAEGTFNELYKNFPDIRFHSCIGHTRYTNRGFIDDAHPRKQKGSAVVHNGNLVNWMELRERYGKKYNFKGETDTETIACIFADEGDDILSGVRRCEAECVGSFNLGIINNRGEMGFYRDSSGNHPLVWVQRGNSAYFASEDVVFKAMQFESGRGIHDIIRDYEELKPGELILMTKNGIERYQIAEPRENFCWMEILYFMRHGSEVRGIPCSDIRRKLGRVVTEKYRGELGADMIFSYSPESGRDYAMGGAEVLNKQVEDVFSVNRHAGRIYITPEGKGEDEVLGRLIKSMLKCPPIIHHVCGQRVVVYEDTIVRSNNSKAQSESLFAAGAKEVIFLVSGPPIRYPCFTGMDHQTRAELGAAPYDVEEANEGVSRDIADKLGVSRDRVRVRYLSFDEMNSVVQEMTGGIHLCSACCDGNYWYDVPDRLEYAFEL